MTRCCKQDPTRECTRCWLTQYWESDLVEPIIEYGTATLDDLFSTFGSANDATGNCRAPDDVAPSHTRTNDQSLLRAWDLTEIQLYRTIVDDFNYALNRQLSTWKQILSSGKLYALPNIRLGTPGIAGPQSDYVYHPYNVDDNANVYGFYRVPARSIIEGDYSAQYTGSFGCDYSGALNEIGEIGRRETFRIGDGGSADPSFNQVIAKFYSVPFFDITVDSLLGTPPPKGSGPGSFTHAVNSDLTIDDYAGLYTKDRPIFLNIQGLGAFNPGRHQTDWTVENHINNGTSVRVDLCVTGSKQKDLLNPDRYSLTYDLIVTLLNTGWSVSFTSEATVDRCFHGETTLSVTNIPRMVLSDPPTFRIPPIGDPNPTSYKAVSPLNLWWINEINQNKSPVLEQPNAEFWAGWINRLAVEEKNTVSDTAVFRARSVKAYRFGATEPYSETYAENGTLDNNQVIEINSIVDDEIKVEFDNWSDSTVEVTDVTFSNPDVISAVNKTTESFSPYEVNSFTFTGSAGATCDPASSAVVADIPAIFQGESEDVVDDVNSSIHMIYDGTGNTWDINVFGGPTPSPLDIALKAYNGNTSYSVEAKWEIIRGGVVVANLSHDTTDNSVGVTYNGSDKDDATYSLNSSVTSIEPRASAVTPTFADPSTYAPAFGDVVRYTAVCTGNSDSIDYTRVWESSIDCTVGGGGSGLGDCDLVFTHDEGGNIIASPFTLKLRRTV